MLSLKLTSMFSGLGAANQFLTRQLKLKVLAPNLVFTVCGSNQSALRQTEEFVAEFETLAGQLGKAELAVEPFLHAFKAQAHKIFYILFNIGGELCVNFS